MGEATSASSPTKKKMGKEVKEHIEESTGDLADDHPKFLAFSDKQLAEMDPCSKNFWVEPEKKKRVPKAKPTQLQTEEDMVEEIVAKEVEEEHNDTNVKTEDDDDLEPVTERKKKKKKKKKLSTSGEGQASFMHSGEDLMDESQATQKKKKKKKKKHSI